jgi:lipoprotein-anchoring transpeptidase ErfK/SrfK
MKSLKNFVGATLGMLSAALFAADSVADSAKPLTPPNLVVQGAWADGSGWTDMIARPRAAGRRITVVQNSLADADTGASHPPPASGYPPFAVSVAPFVAGIAALPPEDQPETGQPKELPPRFRRQMVDYPTTEPAGTIIIDTPNTYLYLILGGGKAMRYGVGVGREGFTWAGREKITRMAEWPDWHPPKEMIDRQPYLPRFMAGGESNPLGARALYLGATEYRIHGTNQPSTIGSFVSSGCIRLTNGDIEDLYSRTTAGTEVVVLPGGDPGRPPAANGTLGAH